MCSAAAFEKKGGGSLSEIGLKPSGCLNEPHNLRLHLN